MVPSCSTGARLHLQSHRSLTFAQAVNFNHRDRCVVRLERERASSSVPAATFVKMSGDACNHTHEWQLLGLNMGLNGNF